MMSYLNHNYKLPKKCLSPIIRDTESELLLNRILFSQTLSCEDQSYILEHGGYFTTIDLIRLQPLYDDIFRKVILMIKRGGRSQYIEKIAIK